MKIVTNHNRINVQISNPDRYSYAMLRIKRDAILLTLVAAACSLSVPILYNHHFAGVLEEGPGNVRCSFTNGKQMSAALLVGADGLHSRVRTSAFPTASSPRYLGQTLLAWSMPRSHLRYPAIATDPDAVIPDAMSLHTHQGVVLFVPEDSNAMEVRIGIQRPLSERSFNEWKSLAGNKSKLVRILRNGFEDSMPDLVKSAIEFAEKDQHVNVFLWPYYILSTLSGWVSRGGKGRVVLIGDAAHAFSPTGGQGAGMAIEDAEDISLILSRIGSGNVEDALDKWGKWRKQRVDRVSEYTMQMGKTRVAPLPQPTMSHNGTKLEETKQPPIKTSDDDMAWLYNWASTEELTAWLDEGCLKTLD